LKWRRPFLMIPHHLKFEEVVAEGIGAEEDDRFVFISDADIEKLMVAELKEELKKRGLILLGEKAELSERLKQGM
jgi:hypothetical protein